MLISKRRGESLFSSLSKRKLDMFRENLREERRRVWKCNKERCHACKCDCLSAVSKLLFTRSGARLLRLTP